MMLGGVIVFFYVDDIVFCYRKKDTEKATAAIDQLKATYRIKDLGELKWFLGIHVIRDRLAKSLWLSQKAYVDRIAKLYGIEGKTPDTPMLSKELLPS